MLRFCSRPLVGSIRDLPLGLAGPLWVPDHSWAQRDFGSSGVRLCVDAGPRHAVGECSRMVIPNATACLNSCRRAPVSRAGSPALLENVYGRREESSARCLPHGLIGRWIFSSGAARWIGSQQRLPRPRISPRHQQIVAAAEVVRRSSFVTRLIQRSSAKDRCGGRASKLEVSQCAALGRGNRDVRIPQW